MDTSLLTAVIALIVAVGGTLTAFATRRKAAADASGVITESAMKLLEPLNKRIEALETLSAEQEKEIAKLRKGIRILIAQLRKIEVKPEWEPEEKG